ncbi:MAG TPA: S8 family peptidase, partial [Trueperaceae bacterium]
VVMLACTLTACPGPSGDTPPQGTISGAVLVGPTPGAALVPQATNPPTTLATQAEFVPGEVIVKFKPGLSAQAVAPLKVGAVELARVRSLGLAGTQLYRAPVRDRAATLEFARQLSARPDVLYAQPNYILKPMNAPNDEFYPLQWHYSAMNLPQAWDITTGSADTVVAVVDTGILYDGDASPRTHPDLAGKILPGFDFISDMQISNDGDGRDADAFDVGDTPGAQSSYHGSHVAGTIAAATNNGQGVAGVNWAAKILPVRVLGVGGGTMADIIDGVLWAAGIPVPGAPLNEHPADVLNLSLGGEGLCPPAEQDAFDQVISTGAIVVVAAGNSNANAGGFSPASCRGVITVGATDFAGHRAPYSNYGSRIDLMAPGGDTSADLNGDQYADGVLSTVLDDTNATFTYAFYQGTSMASPHVAGLVSLMKGLQPSLTASQALAILQDTARPLTAADCKSTLASDCGAGLVDAFAALQALEGGAPPPSAGALTFDPGLLDFGANPEDTTELALTLTNSGGSSVTWQITSFRPAADNPGSLSDGAVYVPAGSPASGTLAPGASDTTHVGIDRTKAPADGFYQLNLVFDVNGVEQRVPVRFTVGAADAPGLSGPMIVAAFLEDAMGELQLSGAEQSGGVISNYSFQALTGSNYVIAWSDENGNTEIDSGDYLGIYPQSVQVTAGANLTGIDVRMDRVVDGSAALPTVSGAWLTQIERALEH